MVDVSGLVIISAGQCCEQAERVGRQAVARRTIGRWGWGRQLGEEATKRQRDDWESLSCPWRALGGTGDEVRRTARWRIGGEIRGCRLGEDVPAGMMRCESVPVPL